MEHKERNESIRLKMLDEIADIEAFSKGRAAAELTADKMWQKAVVMSLINIGELSKAFTEDYLAAMRESVSDPTKIYGLIKKALTDDIHNSEIIMKGIDYSYYYETEE